MNLDTPEQKKHFAKVYLNNRQRARTDLFWLCNEILAPPHSRIMVHHAHDLIVNHCQKFKGWVEAFNINTMKVERGQPICELWDLEGPRNNLLLVSRGHLKSTIHCVGQAIQWILNYPDIRILISSSTGDQVQKFLKEIKEHFQFNDHLRHLFPEFCPKKPADFGNSEQFTVPNRKRKWKEATVETASIGQAKAGLRFEVLICTDVVTETNTRTAGQIKEAKDYFGYLEPLRERGPSKGGEPNPGWKFVEGTIYDFSDYYQMILDHEKNLVEEKRQWHITKQSCWIDKAKGQVLWPERFPIKELNRILESPEVGPYIFSSQYELNPVPPGTGLATEDQIVFVPKQIIGQLMPRYRIYTTVDLATLDGEAKGDSSAMVTAGFDGNGRLDVLQVLNGHYTDQQLVDLMFLTQKIYPRNMEFRVQKDQISGGLKSLLRREMERRGQWLNVKYVPIPTNESKTHRIIRQLQGWFALKLIRFSDAIGDVTKAEIRDQILRFPRGAHDDILDALADQMHSAEGEYVTDAIPRGTTVDQQIEQDFGFNPYAPLYEEPALSNYYSEVGI